MERMTTSYFSMLPASSKINDAEIEMTAESHPELYALVLEALGNFEEGHLGLCPSGFLHCVVCLSECRGVWRRMSDYLRALKALGWLNLNTDFRANNISGDYPQSYKTHVGGMFGLSKFSTKESLDIITGNDLVAVAMREGWEYE
jgi:hypothetical protein